jgi:hypothetical protein
MLAVYELTIIVGWADDRTIPPSRRVFRDRFLPTAKSRWLTCPNVNRRGDHAHAVRVPPSVVPCLYLIILGLLRYLRYFRPSKVLFG